ncbi:hypothetical protein [uncultured Roseobacter sp.]|uniref:hypothetical protein n=1 Tax=uncultured Roseobacter sp. TaxID=114847 RepID=UPI00261FD95F|nr:hypothetical protein [uncultured Roseobacter sp.]
MRRRCPVFKARSEALNSSPRFTPGAGDPNLLSEAGSAFETALSLAPGLALAADGLQKLDQIAIGTAIEVLLQDRRTADMKV